MSALCPFPDRLPDRTSVRSQRAALDHTPSPPRRAPPWNFTRDPHTPAGQVHARTLAARRNAARSGPPTRPGVATINLFEFRTLPDGTNHQVTDETIIPGPAHINTVSSNLIGSGFDSSGAFVEIPELGYFRRMDAAISSGPNDPMTLDLDLDTDGPVTLRAGFMGKNTAGVPSVYGAQIMAVASYRPRTAPRS